MQPVIGITACYDWDKRQFYLAKPYVDSVTQSGGTAVIFPTIDKSLIKRVISGINGLLLSGGFDVSPILYGEEPTSVGKVDPDRDRFEIEVTKLAFKIKMPILAICRGIQVLNVALGGTLKQRVKGMKHYQEADRSQPSHTITIEKGSCFYQIIKRKRLLVNSFHHDGVENLAPVLKASAWAEDGLIEAVEAKDKRRFVLGVQFHPECMYERYPTIRRIFNSFIRAAAK